MIKDIFKIHFSDDNGKIHIDTYIKHKDESGYYLTQNQISGITFLLNEVTKSLNSGGLEALK